MDLVGSYAPAPQVDQDFLVSILLSQWIWLEAFDFHGLTDWDICFNPSESMDLVGSPVNSDGINL